MAAHYKFFLLDSRVRLCYRRYSVSDALAAGITCGNEHFATLLISGLARRTT